MDIVEHEQATDLVDVGALLEDIAERQREMVEGVVGCEIALERGLLVCGDRELLRFAFSNLVVNAFKYSSAEGSVLIRARAADERVEATIEDHGIGIPAAELGRVREPYYRASNAQWLPGTGTGLHLAERIIRQHGGALDISSELGRGTTVVVALPAVSCPAPELETMHGNHHGDRGRSRNREPAPGDAGRTRVQG
jgi:signal transduction histidine kinase